jgi:hypothetical protein
MYQMHAGDMGPVSIVADVNRGWLYPHCFNGWLGRVTVYKPMDQSVVVLWIMSEALFLRSNSYVHRYWWLCERLLCVDRVRYVWSRIIHGLSVGCVWHVGQVFPCRVYINLNHRDSQIWVSLVYSSHHIDNLTSLMSLIVIDVVLLNTLNCLQLLYD